MLRFALRSVLKAEEAVPRGARAKPRLTKLRLPIWRRFSLVFGHWMSVVSTRRKNGLELPVFIRAVNDAHRYGRAPPSVFIN